VTNGNKRPTEQEPDYDLRLGIIIRGLRKNEGLTQQHIAKLVGVSQACISMIESGKRHAKGQRVNLQVYQRIAFVFDRVLSELISLAENIPEPEVAINELDTLIRRLASKQAEERTGARSEWHEDKAQ
jgi:transcriptional regulator with XRE-family HTH domain